MKSIVKKALLGGVCLSLWLAATACALLPTPHEKQFDLKEASLLLDESFEPRKSSDENACFVSERHGYAVSLLKESFSLFEENDEEITVTLREYGQRTIEAKGMTAEVEEAEDMTYYVYEKEVNGKAFTYFASLYLASDGYLTVSFACESKDFAKARPVFEGYARSVALPEADTTA